MKTTTLTEEQEKIKLGRISASSAYKLIPEGRRPMTAEELKEEKKNGGKRKTVDTLFGDTAMTYIYEKVAETLTGQKKYFKPTFEILNGIEMEAEAKVYLEFAKNIKVKELGTQNDLHTAWSIDGWVDEFDTGIEVLCPNSDNHLKYLLGNIKELKENYPVKYWQIHFYCWKYKRKNWKFISYDPRFKLNEHKMLMLDFNVNEADMKYLQMKVNAAIKVKQELLTKAYKLIKS